VILTRTGWALFVPGVITGVMARKVAIDDLPGSESISRMRAAGVITADTAVTAVSFGDLSFNVAVSHRKFPNGGSWSFFQCPCGRRCRVLRLYEGRELACRWCLGARGLRPRAELIATSHRAAHVVPKLLARLTSSSPARLHPRPGRVLDRRSRLEAKVRRSLIVAREYALEEHGEMLARLERGRDK
jgi:hypothetical protein